jgi:hypothetical protein
MPSYYVRTQKLPFKSFPIHRSSLHPTLGSLGTEKKNPWPESASELYRAKAVPTFADRGCHVVRVMDPYGRILDLLDGAATFSFK